MLQRLAVDNYDIIEIREMINMKKTVSVILALVLLFLFCGCVKRIDMPFNGNVKFREIELTIPERFVRDSTQSSENMFIFERGYYEEYIIISGNESQNAAAPDLGLEKYMEQMLSVNAESKIIPFLDRKAVLSTYYKEDLYCQEVFFYHGSQAYAIALRGGTEDAFWEIANSVRTGEETENAAG